MQKISRTIDDIFEMSDSRYSLVNAISRKAREIADDAENNNDVLYRKPVNMVIDRLLDGRATIEHIEEVPEDDLFDDEERYAPEATVPVYAELEEAEDEEEEREPDEEGSADFDTDSDEEDNGGEE